MWSLIACVAVVLILLKPATRRIGAGPRSDGPARELYQRRLRSGHEG